MAAGAPGEDILVAIGGDDVPMTLADFFAANADGIEGDERAEIVASLISHGDHVGGGGAGAEWRLYLTDGRLPPGLDPEAFRSDRPAPGTP